MFSFGIYIRTAIKKFQLFENKFYIAVCKFIRL